MTIKECKERLERFEELRNFLGIAKQMDATAEIGRRDIELVIIAIDRSIGIEYLNIEHLEEREH